MGKEDKNNKQKEGEDMSAVLEKKYEEFQEKLARITAKASPLKTKNGMIELDPNNPQHKEWFEEEDQKGK
ncbi:MAG: hypothetical protein RO469_16940 [Thermincola sp.]|jgi:alkaline phosphatase|nr:hypothetical protein [Thermincola sp.]MDT3703040.1 hypothetical protein [Thermincola sp.]